MAIKVGNYVRPKHKYGIIDATGTVWFRGSAAKVIKFSNDGRKAEVKISVTNESMWVSIEEIELTKEKRNRSN